MTADTDTDTMPEPGTIAEARRIVGSDLREAFLLGADGVVALARLAIAEHERAEALARRVAELEAQMQWLPHGGGPQPVGGPVWVMHRNGDESGPMDANALCWDHIGPQYEDGDADIVAYRTTDPNAETGEARHRVDPARGWC